MEFVRAFIVGGLICVVGQILLQRTKLTPARIVVIFVAAGAILTGLGLYQPLVDFAGAGADCSADGVWVYPGQGCHGRGAKFRYPGRIYRTF